MALADAASTNPLFSTPNVGVNTNLAVLCQGGTILGTLGGFGPGARVPPPAGVGALTLGVPLPPPGTSTFCQDQTVP